MYTLSMSPAEWGQELPGQPPTRILNVQPFADLNELIPSAFMLCVKPSRNNIAEFDIQNITMLATHPEQLIGSHRLNRTLMYVNDLGDEAFGYEEIDEGDPSYLRRQGVPIKTLELLRQRVR